MHIDEVIAIVRADRDLKSIVDEAVATVLKAQYSGVFIHVVVVRGRLIILSHQLIVPATALLGRFDV